MHRAPSTNSTAVANAFGGVNISDSANSVEVFPKNARKLPAMIGRQRRLGANGIKPLKADTPMRSACGSIWRKKWNANSKVGDRKKTNVTLTKANVTAQLSAPGRRFFLRFQT